jgi:hypothetical protein
VETLDEMDKFLYASNQPKLNQENINHFNRSTISNAIEAVIKSLPTQKSPGSDGFRVDFTKPFRKEQIPILLKLFQEVEREGTLSNSLYEASIILIPKHNKHARTKREL